MAHQSFNRIGFVMDREAIHHGGAGLIESDDLDLRSLAAELDDHLVQALTAVMSQKWARLTSMRTFSITSLKSKALTKRSAEAKNTWPMI